MNPNGSGQPFVPPDGESHFGHLSLGILIGREPVFANRLQMLRHGNDTGPKVRLAVNQEEAFACVRGHVREE